VLQLTVVDGLPATILGSVLAHEMGHAWLAGCPDADRDEATEEGIWLYAMKRGKRPLIGVAPGVCHSTPQCSSGRSR
jgi:hypothetical protein